MSKAVVIIGGHGHIALRLARLLSPHHTVTSIIRDPAHAPDITSTGATPVVLSLEHEPASRFAALFSSLRPDTVYFSAGSGGKGGAERTQAVDYDGAVKIFDAIEAMEVGSGGDRPHLVLVSTIDSRHPDKVPEHYNEEDLEMSKKVRDSIGTYFKCKYEADANLAKRTAFPWTIVRPCLLLHEPGTGKAEIGRTHITSSIARDDVAVLLAHLVNRRDAAGLGLDMASGEVPIGEGVDAAIAKRDVNLYL